MLGIARDGIHPQHEWILYSLEIRWNKIKITELIITEMLEVKGAVLSGIIQKYQNLRSYHTKPY